MGAQGVKGEKQLGILQYAEGGLALFENFRFKKGERLQLVDEPFFAPPCAFGDCGNAPGCLAEKGNYFIRLAVLSYSEDKGPGQKPFTNG